MNCAYLKSPCRSCDFLGSETYPDCSEDCLPINRYLIAIGEIPHRPKNDKDLTYLNPTNRKQVVREIDPSRCTREQYQNVKELINSYRIKNDKSIGNMALEVGVSATMISNMSGGRARGQNRMTVRNYNICMDWCKKMGLI